MLYSYTIYYFEKIYILFFLSCSDQNALISTNVCYLIEQISQTVFLQNTRDKLKLSRFNNFELFICLRHIFIYILFNEKQSIIQFYLIRVVYITRLINIFQILPVGTTFDTVPRFNTSVKLNKTKSTKNSFEVHFINNSFSNHKNSCLNMNYIVLRSIVYCIYTT